MTTGSLARSPFRGAAARVIGWTTLLTGLLGAVLVGLAALSGGQAMAAAAAAGTLLALLVFLLGTVVVGTVSGLVPAASLLVALATYLLQVLAMALVFQALSDSELLAEDGSRAWLAAAVIATTAAWIVGQIVVTTRSRMPAFDLPGEPGEPRPGARQRGAR